MEKFEEFCDLLKEYIKNIEKITSWERDLTNLASCEQHALIETHVQKIQPVFLQYRGLEAERLQWMKANGFEGLNGKELMEELSEPEKEIYKPIYERLCNVCEDMKREEENCNRILSLRLSDIKLLLLEHSEELKRKQTDFYV